MKTLKITILLITSSACLIFTSAFVKGKTKCVKPTMISVYNPQQNQTMNLFVTHGHCSTPFAGKVNDLSVMAVARKDGGNPLENMKISFEIDPNTFNVCRGEEFTEIIKTPGLFIGENNEKFIFKSTNVYTMGMDWYQVNGRLSIKGVERDVKFFATGIREPDASMASTLVLEGRMDLTNWGIDYDKIVNGKSDSVPTKWMHMNMRIILSKNWYNVR